MEFSYLSVLEIQPARYHESGVPALHIHYVSSCYLPGTWEFIISADGYRDIWRKVCMSVVGGGAAVGASVDAQVVKKDAGAYLAKYFSKGVEHLGGLVEYAPSQLPSRWWSSSRNLKSAVKRYTVDLSGSLAEFLFYRGGGIPGDILYMRYFSYIYAPVGGVDICVGMTAHIRDSDAACLRSPAFWISLQYEL